MDRVPQEILSSIIGCANTDSTSSQPLSQFATVSKKWQEAVESITFRSLKLRGTDLIPFNEAFKLQKVVRRGYLRIIKIECIFDRNPEGCCQVTQTVNREADSNTWSSLIGCLFATLKNVSQCYEARFQTPPNISLIFLHASRPGPHYGGARLMGHCVCCNAGEHTTRELEASRPRPGTIICRDTDLLPSLTDVSSFEVVVIGESQYLHPGWIGMLAQKLPSLRHIEINLEDPYDWGCDWRKQYQYDSYTSLAKIQPCSIEFLRLEIETHELENEHIPVHRLSDPGSKSHVYNRVLEHLSTFHSLRYLYLTGPLTVSPALFQNLESSTFKTIFPALEIFALEFTPATADGRWFYLRDDAIFASPPLFDDDGEEYADWEDNESDESYPDEDYFETSGDDKKGWVVYEATPVRTGKVSRYQKFRSLPNSETLSPLLISAARVCGRMPRIRQFSLKVKTCGGMYEDHDLDYDFVKRIFEVWFVSAGMTLEVPRLPFVVWNPVIDHDIDIIHYNRVYFRTGKYRPDDSIIKSWRDVIGSEGKVNFLDESYCNRYGPPYWNDRMHYTGALHES